MSTAVVDQGNTGEDEIEFAEGIAENQQSFEESITIKRFSSQSSTPDAFGHAPVPAYTLIDATAVIDMMNVSSELVKEGTLIAGDLRLEIVDQLLESNETMAGTYPGDRVVYRGMEYRQVQRPVPIYLGNDVAYYEVYLRRANLTSDVTGQ